MVQEVVGWAVFNAVYQGLAAALLVFWAGIWCLHAIAIIYGCHKLHRRGAAAAAAAAAGSGGGDAAEKGEAAMGVSVLKPLVGTPMDPNLMTNLESFFTMDYPKYELRFCIAEEGDPAIMIVKQLMSKYPNVEASVHVGMSQVGVNPKINNMHGAYDGAVHPLLLVSDAALFMKPDTLSDMVAHMTADVGIVHQMPFTTDRKGWPAVLEKVYFGTAHARMYLFLGLLDAMGMRINCCTGMSCLMRKKVLDQAGGLGAFGKYLAEDFFFAKHIQNCGWRISISAQPAWQNHGIASVHALMARLTRWIKLRVKMVPSTLVLDPLTECLLLGLLSSLAATVHLQVDFLAFFLFHTLSWILADWTMLNIVQNGPPPFSKFEFVISWLFREASALLLFIRAVQQPVIVWRSSQFRVRWGGLAEQIHPPPPPPSLQPTAVAII